jgi:hypothetical protein
LSVTTSGPIRLRTASERRRLLDSNCLTSLTNQKCIATVGDARKTWKSRGKKGVGAVLGLAGAGGGAYGGVVLGALIGTLVCPGVGTTIGGVLGGVLGFLVTGSAFYKGGGWLGGLAGAKLGERHGISLAQERVSMRNYALRSMKNLSANRSADSLPRIRRPSVKSITDLADRYLEFKHGLQKNRILPKSGASRGNGKTRGHTRLMAGMRKDVSKARRAVDCRRLARQGDIADLVFAYEMDAAKACDRVVETLSGDKRGDQVNTSEQQLAKCFADAQTQCWLAYYVERAQWDHLPAGTRGVVPKRLESPEHYFVEMAAKAFDRRNISCGEGAERVRALFTSDSAVQRLYAATRKLAAFAPPGMCADVFHDCLRMTLRAAAGFSKETDALLARTNKEIDAQARAKHRRRASRSGASSGKADLRQADKAGADNALNAAVNNLPRLMAVEDTLARGGSKLPISQQRRIGGALPTLFEVPELEE